MERNTSEVWTIIELNKVYVDRHGSEMTPEELAFAKGRITGLDEALSILNSGLESVLRDLIDRWNLYD